jgi:WD40 repeat protein
MRFAGPGFVAVAALLLRLGIGGWYFDAAEPPPAGSHATIWEHRGSVLSLAFSPDGKTLLTGGASQTDEAVLWDVATAKRRSALKGGGLIYSVAFSPDSTRVATAGWVGIKEKKPTAKVALWEAASNKEALTLKGYESSAVPCVAFFPDGKTVATGGGRARGESVTGLVQLWDAATGKERGAFAGHAAPIVALVISPDGKTVAGAANGPDTAVILWDVSTGKQKMILRSRRDWARIRALAFSPDGQTLAWGAANEVDGNSELFLWDLITGKRIAALPERGGVGASPSPPTAGRWPRGGST